MTRRAWSLPVLLLLGVVLTGVLGPLLSDTGSLRAQDHGQEQVTGDDVAHEVSESHGGHRELAMFEVPAPITDRGVLPPALILILGALAIPFLPRYARSLVAVGIPVVTFAYVMTRLEPGVTTTVPFLDLTLHVVRADRLSIIFGMIFTAIGAIAGLYAWHNEDRVQQVAALLYNAGSVGATFAGDYFTLYAFWELMAVSSTLLIWSRRTPDSARAGGRYILVHLTGGTILLGGILLNLQATGSIAFEHFAPGAGGIAAWLILIGFCVNAAVPPLGPWLPDSYPRATVTGAIFCSALTTKTAVYALIRGFYGWEVLLVAGVIMSLYGVVYAVLANDIRELLAYHIISQVGYMVAGAGLGTELAINGATAHAVCHILYKAVLFMGAGAVIYTTGKEKLTELGGFVRRQKLIFALYMIGAFSISGFPLWNGFISKSMVTAAAHEMHIDWAFLGLMLASVGTFLHTGLKLPYGVWFGEDSGIQPTKAPWNMIAALAVAGFLCTLLGVYPALLYRYLPFAVNWEPYTPEHLVEMIQLLLFTFFAFYLFIPKLGGQPTISMDTDVLYRKPAPAARFVFVTAVGAFFDWVQRVSIGAAHRVNGWLADPTGRLPGALPRIATDEPGYDEDRNRRPLGVSLALTLLGFVVLAFWILSAGMR